MEKEKTFDELFDEILENFDWERVHKTMVFLDWDWYDKKGSKVPTIGSIIKKAKELCLSAYNSNVDSVATGGFCATFDDGILTLEFVLCDCFADIRNYI